MTDPRRRWAARHDNDGDGPSRRPEAGGRALVLVTLALPLLIALYGVLLYLSAPRTGGRELRIDQFFQLVRQGRVDNATVLSIDNRVVGSFDGGAYWVAFAPGREALFTRLLDSLEQASVPTSVSQQSLKAALAPLTGLVPVLILVDVLVMLVFLGRRQAGALAGFGQSRGLRLRAGQSGGSFAEVAGLDEVVDELEELSHFLVSPERFIAMGAVIPKGVLLCGPPGCGKTLLARAVAGEAKVPFFSLSGSEFVEMYVGVGAARIRDLFHSAKAAAPAIVFIDELDAVGRGRSGTATGGQDERDATLNQLLVEMDGFDPAAGVLVMAATNRPDILDPALLRPGRFDRRVSVDPPDLGGRRAILAVHARGKPVAEGVDWDVVARRTPGFAGADLANVVNEAALLAARRHGAAIEPTDVAEAIERVVAGPERRSRILSVLDKRRIAVHEAGHAVVASALPGTGPVAKVSVIARSATHGLTWYSPETDSVVATESQLRHRLTAMLAGRAAERLVLGEGSTGASDDLVRATELAHRMVVELGMSERLGPVSFRGLALGRSAEGWSSSVELGSEVNAEVKAIVHDADKAATVLLEGHLETLEAISAKLVEGETLEGATLELLLAPISGPRMTIDT